jgi:hypothetical protein
MMNASILNSLLSYNQTVTRLCCIRTAGGRLTVKNKVKVVG